MLANRPDVLGVVWHPGLLYIALWLLRLCLVTVALGSFILLVLGVVSSVRTDIKRKLMHASFWPTVGLVTLEATVGWLFSK